jgi:Mrp family chromosome partitioning ATPase
VILVARSGHTGVAPLNQALATMAQVDAPVIGIVLNRVKPRDAMTDGYTYGSNYGKTSEPPTTSGLTALLPPSTPVSR